MFKQSKAWLLLSLLGLACLFLLLNWNSFNAPLDRDEGNYAYGAWLLTVGKLPYLDTFEQKPPLIYLPYWLGLQLDPAAVWPPRLLAALSFALTSLLLGLAAGRDFNRRTGWLTAWLVMPLAMLPYFLPFAANTEKFMLLPLVGLLAIEAFNRESRSGWPWFWGGVCGMLAILYKQLALLVVAYIFIVWLAAARARAPKAAAGLAGALLAFCLVMGYFIWRVGPAPLIEQLFEYNRYYALSHGGLTLTWLIRHLRILWSAWPGLFLLLAWFLVRRPGRWWYYLGLWLVAWLSVFNSPYGHYLIMLMPFWAVITAAALDSFISWTEQRLPNERALALGLAALAVCSFCWPARAYYLYSPAELVANLYGPRNPFGESPVIAKRIAELTAPGDPIYVFGTEQQIYFYAKRVSSSPISGVYGLMLAHPKALAYQRRLISDLEKRPPAAVVLVRSPISWLRLPASPTLIIDYLDRLLKTRYVPVGGAVRRGSRTWWEEPLKPTSLGYCGLLLFKRK